jgi:PEP-CTERM motif
MKKFIQPIIVLLGLASAQTTTAAVIYSGAQDIPVPATFFTGVYVNIASGAFQVSATNPATWTTEPWFSMDLGGEDIFNGPLFRPVILGSDRVLNLSFGTPVSSGSNFAAGASASILSHVGPAADQFQVNSPGYAAFAFEMTPGGPTHYGWTMLTVNNTGVGAGTIHSWAYESVPGVAIPVGAVPEPGTLGLALLGSLALIRRRRRQLSI